LALPPDTQNEAFLREVDENLRRDQLETFAKRYGTWIIGAVVLFLIAVGAWLYWQNRQQEKTSAQTEELSAIYDQIAGGQTDAAKKRLKPLETSRNDVMRAIAQMTEAAIALQGNDRDTALAKYHAIASDSSLPKAYRDAALLRSTSLEFDTMKPEAVIAAMQPLTTPDSAWFGSAGELTAMAYLKQGQKDKAGRLFASIAGDEKVPDTIRNRAQQIAGTLGIDVAVAAPQASQPGTSE
jgi:hypothetical protein